MMVEWFKNIVLTCKASLMGISLRDDADRKRKLTLLLLAAGIFAGSGFLLHDVLTSNHAEMVVDILTISLFGVCVIAVNKFYRRKVVYRLSVSVLLVGLLCATCIDVNSGSKFFLMLIFPLLYPTLLGNKEGMIWNAGTLLANIGIMLWNMDALQPAFSMFVFRFSVAYLCVSSVSFIQEWIRELYFRKLIDEKEGLVMLNKEMKRISVTDKLTGIYNRSYLDGGLEEEFAVARKTGRALSVALCDVDYFKLINDEYGHPAGDAILKQVSSLLAESLRKDIDWIARYGGEEFILIFPETDVSTAKKISERIRRNMEKTRFTWKDAKISVNVSIGIATFTKKSAPVFTTYESLIDRADEALYHAKRTGRNKVVVYNDIESQASSKRKERMRYSA